MSFKDKQVLITGGMGFIGSNLAIKLVSEGARVTILDAMLPQYGGNFYNLESVKTQLEINTSDMRDKSKLLDLVKGKEFIFNLAGQVSHQDSMTDPFLDLDVNVKAQLNLLEACRQCAAGSVIVYSSTRQLYGAPEYLPVDERHPVNPTDVNGINKLAAEQYHSLYSKVYGMKIVSLRLTNTYGPRQLIKNARQGFVGWFVNRAILGETIQLFGTGEQIRDFTYVDDVVSALCIAASTPNCHGRVYNLGGEQATLKQVAELLIKHCGKGRIEITPFPEERRKIDIGNFYGSYEKFAADVGWRPKIGLSDGLRNMIDYYKANKDFYLE